MFSRISEIATRHRNLSSPSNALRDGDLPRESHLFVDDGVLIGPDLADRLRLRTDVCGEGSYMVIGAGARNIQKLEIEGLRRTIKIAICYEIDFGDPPIDLPMGGIIGACSP